MAVCNSSTELVDRYDEGIEYLRKATQIAPNSEKILAAFNELTNKCAKWYLFLGTKYSLTASNLLQQGINANKEIYDGIECSLKALKYQPDIFEALQGIDGMVQAGSKLGVRFGNDIYAQLQVLAALRAKRVAEQKLPRLRTELERLNASLAKLKTETGLFTGNKIKNTEANIQKIKSEIQSLDKAVAFEAPKVKL